ncbi:MAG: type IV pilus secretin PilQ [Thermodesulfobacteriota bacterium]|nr:type IV pilus secretin PilQ [Thermodesulfobacteriota bacterium]
MKHTKHNNQIKGFIFFPVLICVFFFFACSTKGIQVRSQASENKKELINQIQKVDISEDKEVTIITIVGSAPFTYTVFRSDAQAKIVVDVHGANLEGLQDTIFVNNGTISKITCAQFDDEAGKVGRLEVFLDKLVDYEVVALADMLEIYVMKYIEPQAVAVFTEKGKGIGIVEDIDFKQTMAKSQIIVSTTSKASYDLFRVSEDTLVLELHEMELPQRLIKSMEVEHRDSAIKRIKPYQSVISGEKGVKIDIELKTMVPYHIFQEKNAIYLDIDQPKEIITERLPALHRTEIGKIAKAQRPKESEEVIQMKKEENKVVSYTPETQEDSIERKYAGKKISLDFKDGDIMNLFRLIADISNLNLIAGEEVKGKVTIRMVDVPWDQALDVILETNNLEMVKEGNIMRIAPSGILRKKEETEKLVTRIIPINYATAGGIMQQIKLTGRGKASADERTNSLIISDIKSSIQEAMDIITKLDTPTPQVLIEARIIQTNPTFTTEMGIQWGGAYSNVAGGSDYWFQGEAGNLFAINLPSSAIHGGLGYGFVNSSATLDIRLTAMEKDEKVKIISRPRIVTLDNKTAKIEQGVALPYLKMSDDGTTVSTEFKDATLSLEVTPHITPDGSIVMQVLAKKDQKSSQTGFAGEPGIDTRSAKTEVLVKDGETTVIGGIYENIQTYSASGVPYFSNIPIIGWIFKNRLKRDETTELLIFLTPTIVKQKPVV